MNKVFTILLIVAMLAIIGCAKEYMIVFVVDIEDSRNEREIPDSMLRTMSSRMLIDFFNNKWELGLIKSAVDFEQDDNRPLYGKEYIFSRAKRRKDIYHFNIIPNDY